MLTDQYRCARTFTIFDRDDELLFDCRVTVRSERAWGATPGYDEVDVHVESVLLNGDPPTPRLAQELTERHYEELLESADEARAAGDL